MRAVRAALAATTSLAVAGLTWSVAIERRWWALRHTTVPCLRSSAQRPLRVLHLSDLHLLPWQRDKLNFVRSCAEVEPEVVVGTGDFLGHPQAVAPAVEVLTDVARGRIAIAVLGSNDLYAPRMKNPAGYLYARERRVHGRRLDTDALVAGLTDGGWHVVDNRRVLVPTPAGDVDVVGLGDPHIRRDRPDRVDWAVPRGAVALRLGVVHAPYRRALDAFADMDLVLAGHTHGGQLRLPGYGAIVTNCDLPPERARGLSRDGTGAWLHVSAGLGTSMYAPARFACRPEATLLDLVATPFG